MRSYILLIALAVLAAGAECWYTCTRTGYGISYCTAEDCIVAGGPYVQPGDRLYIAPYAIVEVCQCYNAGVFKQTTTTITCQMADNRTTVYTTHNAQGIDDIIICLIVASGVLIALVALVCGVCVGVHCFTRLIHCRAKIRLPDSIIPIVACIGACFVVWVRRVSGNNLAFTPVGGAGGAGMPNAGMPNAGMPNAVTVAVAADDAADDTSV